MQRVYVNYSQYTGPWSWPNFTPKEVSCKHCGELYLDPPSLDALQLLRDGWGKLIVINSAHRCTFHNHVVGGTKNSQHLKLAFDCAVQRKDQEAFIAAARIAGFTGIGKYSGRGFVHLDLGPKREWIG